MRNCTEIGEKTTTLYGNVRKSDLVEIWFELASQLDINCSENVKKNNCKKLFVELKYKTKDNNDYFSKIGLLTNHNVPHTTTDYTSFMPDPIKNSMFIEPITSNSIILATCKLKTKLSSGHDGIFSKLLKETIFHIVHPITGIVPDQLIIAKVVPIYKASDNSLLNNYRPI